MAAKKNQTQRTSDRILTLPGLNTPGNKIEGVQFAGYISVKGNNPKEDPDSKLFYWFAGTDDYKNRPTVIWSNGGPGSTSFWGFFTENGPFNVEYPNNGDEPLVTMRKNSWTNKVNYLMFEHPLSVTISFAPDKDVPKSVEQGMHQYYNALNHFLDLHPEIREQPIFLAGESYAGTYLPLLAKNILQGNLTLPKEKQINLIGTVLVDAWVDPYVQMEQDTNYYHSHGMITAYQKEVLDRTVKVTDMANTVQGMTNMYMANTAALGDPPMDPVLKYLNNNEFRAIVGAPPTTKENTVTSDWSAVVGANYTPEANKSFRWLVNELIDGDSNKNAGQHPVIVISGLNDAKDCNFLGTEAWLNKLEGPTASAFKLAPTVLWQTKDKTPVTIGFDQNGGILTWLKVLNAGHLAVMDQPLIIDFIMERLGLK